MNNSIYAFSCKGMCNAVRVILLVVSSGGIFVASIKHSILFAGELVQSKDSAGTWSRTYCAFLGPQDTIGLTSQKNLSWSSKVTLTAHQEGRAGNSATCEESGWAWQDKDHTEHVWRLTSKVSYSPVCLHPHLLGYPEAVNGSGRDLLVPAQPCWCCCCRKQDPNGSMSCRQLGRAVVLQVTMRPATASWSERELQDGQEQPRRMDDLDCTSISPYPSHFNLVRGFQIIFSINDWCASCFRGGIRWGARSLMLAIGPSVGDPADFSGSTCWGGDSLRTRGILPVLCQQLSLLSTGRGMVEGTAVLNLKVFILVFSRLRHASVHGSGCQMPLELLKEYLSTFLSSPHSIRKKPKPKSYKKTHLKTCSLIIISV